MTTENFFRHRLRIASAVLFNDRIVVVREYGAARIKS